MRLGLLDSVNSGQYITATANSAGLAQGFLGPVPAGYCWYLERYTTWSNTSKTSGVSCEVFVIPEQQLPTSYTATVGDRAGRQDYTASGQNAVSDNESPVFVGEGYYVVVLWLGLNSGDVAQFSVQIAVHQTSLTITSAQDVEHETEETPDLTVEQEADAVETAQTADMFRSLDTVI